MSKETRYHIIKESEINLKLLPQSIEYLNSKKGFENIEGDTHKAYRLCGQVEHSKTFKYSTFGVMRSKGGVAYWVSPYYYIKQLGDVVRKVDNVVVSKTLTLDEYLNFGWDKEEE